VAVTVFGLLLIRDARSLELCLILIFAVLLRFEGVRQALLIAAGTLAGLFFIRKATLDQFVVREMIGYIIGVAVIWICFGIPRKTAMSEQEDQKKRLKENEARLRLVIDTIPALVWCANPDGGPAFLNKRMVEFLGIHDREAIQLVGTLEHPSLTAISQWKQMLHPDDYDAAFEVWLHAVETGAPYNSVHRMRRFDGTYRWFQSKGEALRDEKGAILSWYGLNVDIDDARRNEEALSETRDKLARAMQMATIAELSASVAHEINQPLAALVANGRACHHWLAATPPNFERVGSTVGRIVRDAEATADIVKRIRALFKKAEPNKIALDVNDVIHEVLRLVKEQARRRNIKVDTSLPPDLPKVLADKIQVQQLIMNLVQNALDAMSSVSTGGHTLFVYSIFNQQTAVTISICDSGCGFSDQGKIFEPFYTTKEQGMGMGLAICKSIAEQHGGDLHARLNKSQGATFSFTLPVA
jgi:PAS domain S-box-containing protein